MAWLDFFWFVSSSRCGINILDVRQIQESTPDAVAKENHVRKTLGMRNFRGWDKGAMGVSKKIQT